MAAGEGRGIRDVPSNSAGVMPHSVATGHVTEALICAEGCNQSIVVGCPLGLSVRRGQLQRDVLMKNYVS